MKTLASCILFCSALQSAFAAPALVKDIFNANTLAGSNPNNHLLMDGYSYFIAFTDEVGSELWRTDGTVDGTTLVKDIRPGPSSSNLSNLTALGTTLYFTADNETNGTELWKSDGTEAGTVLVKDIRPGSSGSSPRYLTVLGSHLYLMANDGTSGSELWKSDGTDAGTVRVKDVRPGSGDGVPGFGNRAMVAFNGMLYFGGDSGTGGRELWRSDGTDSGTTLFFAIDPGNGGSDPENFVVAGNTLYFFADNGATGDELWKTDGTVGGTALCREIRFGTSSSSIQNISPRGNSVVFSANNGVNGVEPWISDGTLAGTVMIKDISLSGSSFPARFLTVGATTYFTANDGSAGVELWKTDGTNAGTSMIADINPAFGDSSNPLDIIPFGSGILFSAFNNAQGRELWKSDGSEAGTELVKEIFPGVTSGVNNGSEGQPFFAVIGSNAYFGATNGQPAGTPFSAYELWKTDGTSEGTVLFKDLNSSARSSNPSRFVSMGGKLYFFATDAASGTELWRSDGTEAGTVLVKDLTPGVGSRTVPTTGVAVVGGNTLYFALSKPDESYDLWKSDGTTAGTVVVGSAGGYISGFPVQPESFTAVGKTLYFVSGTLETGKELWKSNGTAAGTGIVKDIASGVGDSSPSDLTAVGNNLFFVARQNAEIGRELWRSNGTGTGTILMKDINTSGDNNAASNLTAVGDTLYFTANHPQEGKELWKSKGTPASTVQVADIRRGGDSSPRNFAAVGNTLFFAALGESGGVELWKSNGTAAGTVMVKDIIPGETSGNPQLLHVVGSTLFFVANDGTTGLELWKSNGTTDGTVLVKDITPGPFGQGPLELATGGNLLFFSADDGVNGRELWQSDGTPAGTVLSGDLTGNSGSSFPQRLKVAGSKLFFSATTAATGRELFAIAVTGGEPPVVDTKKPTQSLTSKGGRLINGTYTLTGIAKDNVGVTRVEVSVNGGAVQFATLGALLNGGRSFELAGIVLENGLNTLVITSFDESGNASSASSLKITYLNTRPALAGSYTGLITSTGAATNDRTGLLTLKATPTGGFTGNVSIGFTTLAIRGIFDNAGNARFNVKGNTSGAATNLLLSKKKGKITTVFGTLALAGIPGGVIGSISDDTPTELAEIEADRAFFDGKTSATTVAATFLENKGFYTAYFPARATQAGLTAADYPQGAGVATLKVTAKGLVTLRGTLADGTALTASAPLSETYAWPMFKRLYSTLGAIAGRVQFDPLQAETDLLGTDLTWIRPERLTSKHYPTGWPIGILTDLRGAKYTYNTWGSSAFPFGFPLFTEGNATLTFSAGRLTAPVTATIHISFRNKVSEVPASSSFSASFKPTTGALSGYFTHDDASKPKWRSIVYQKGSAKGGHGFFLSTVPRNAPTGESGLVRVEAQ